MEGHKLKINQTPSLYIKTEKKNLFKPCKITDHASVLIKNNIVILGGRFDKTGWSKNLHVYNLKSGQWEVKTIQPTQKKQEIYVKGNLYKNLSNLQIRMCHCLVALDNWIYIIGGSTSESSQQWDKEVHKVDFETLKSQKIGQLDDILLYASANLYKNDILIYGGISKPKSYKVWNLSRYSLTRNVHEEIKLKGMLPQTRFHVCHSSIIIKDKFYIFGGIDTWQWTLYDKEFYKDMYQIDLLTNTFTTIEQKGSIPSPRMNFSMFSFYNKIYIFGGFAIKTDKNWSWKEIITFNDFYQFDVNSQNWRKLNNQKLLERSGHSTVAVPQENKSKLKVYLIGGLGKQTQLDHQEMDIISMYDVSSYYWLLHYLQMTGMQQLLGLNICQEIIELFE